MSTTADNNHDQWADEFPRHAWALEKMSAGPFRSSLANRVSLQGSLSDKQMSVLWEKADQLELVLLGELVVPRVNNAVSVDAIITKASEVDKDGVLVYRVAFTAEEGWRGRVDITNGDLEVIEALATRSTDQCHINGIVEWVRETFVILVDNVGAVKLG